MTTTDAVNSDVTRRLDHVALDQEISEWRDWWGQLAEIGKPKFDEMASRLVKFRAQLAEHFEAEEVDGCLSLAKGTSVEMDPKTAELRNEHQTLLVDLDRLVSQLQGCEPKIDCWGRAREEFEEFLDRLNLHEDAEDELSSQVP